MPTGYTADLCERDVPFEKFVLTCARGMGALIEMRDDPFDAPIPAEFKPSDYHSEHIESAQAEIERLTSMTDSQADAEAEKEHQNEMGEHAKSVARTSATRGRLVLMRRKVAAWSPPTSEHDGFKKFMLEQLDETIKWDGTYSLSKPKKQSGKAWKAANLKRLKDSVVYHKEMHAEEIKRARERTQWVNDLRASLRETQNT